MEHGTIYLSPYSWRYGSSEMREIWSEINKRRLWREIWVALAEVQETYTIVSPNQVADLHQHVQEVDVQRSLDIEAVIQHDLMAELKVFASQCPIGGSILHLGATSMDIEDNADAIRIKSSLSLLLKRLSTLLIILTEKIELWAEEVLIAYTHLQPAEPSTLGYRIACYTQDLWLDWQNLSSLYTTIKGKGFKGAVGSGASYVELMDLQNLMEFEARLSQRLELEFYPITTQVSPRKQEYFLISALAGLGASLYKAAFDLRLLQTPAIGEISEPFASNQVGSSAMPFKRNPIQAEKINSLGRWLAQMPRTAWDNAAHSLLERTLDDSANRRSLLPEAFLICDEMLLTYEKIIQGLQVNQDAIRRNRKIYMPFAATERVLLAMCKAGADRQDVHERLRLHALVAWQDIIIGKNNPLTALIYQDVFFLNYLSRRKMKQLMNGENYVGDAPQRACAFAQQIRKRVQNIPCKEYAPA